MPDPFPLPPRAVESNKDFFKRINTTSPVLRDKAGYFVNSLEKVANIIEIPFQTLLQVGKNIGEEIVQKELGNETFATDLKNALSGRSHISFHDVMRSVNLDALDAKLPDFMLLNESDEKWGRWGSAILTGVATSFLASPIAGITAGFATNEALYGKGVVSSFADIAFDPANKVRILPKTAKGLGVSDDVMRTMTKQGRLEDFVTSGFAYMPKKGALKATEDLFEVTLKGVPTEIQTTLGNTLKHFENLSPNKVKGVVNKEGLELLAQNKSKIVQAELKQITKAGKYGSDALEKISIKPMQSSLLGSLLAGDRHLFDFKGSSGLVLTQNTPFAGKFLIPTHITSIDAGNFLGGNVVAGVMDKSIDFLGANILPKIPGMKHIAEFEAKHLQPITNFIANKIKAPFVSLGVVGGDEALKGRRTVETVLADKDHPARQVTMSNLESFPGKTIEDKVNAFEDALRKGSEKQATGVSILDRESDTYIMNAWNTIKQITLANISDTKLVKNALKISHVGGEDVMKAMEEGFRRQANLTVEELSKLDPMNPENYKAFMDAYNTSVMMKENINSFLVSDAIKKNIEDLKDVTELKDYIRQVHPDLLAGLDQLDEVHLPLTTKLDAEVAPDAWKDTIKGSTSEGTQEIKFYNNKITGFIFELTEQKELLEKELENIKPSVTKKLDQVIKEKAVVQSAIDKVKDKIFKELEDEKTLIKMLKDTDIYDTALAQLKNLRAKATKELKGTSNAGVINKEISATQALIKGHTEDITILEKEIADHDALLPKLESDLAKAEKELHEANLRKVTKKKKEKQEPIGEKPSLAKEGDDPLVVETFRDELKQKVYDRGKKNPVVKGINYDNREDVILEESTKIKNGGLNSVDLKNAKLRLQQAEDVKEILGLEQTLKELESGTKTIKPVVKQTKEILPKVDDTKRLEKIADLESKIQEITKKIDDHKNTPIEGRKAKLDKALADKIASEDRLAGLKDSGAVLDDASVSKLNRLKTMAEATENPKAVNEYIRFREDLKKQFKDLLDNPEVLNSYIKQTPKLKKKAELIARKQDKVTLAEEHADFSTKTQAELEGKVNVNEADLRLVTKMNASLNKVLELRGKQAVDMSLIPPASRRIYAKALELLGDNFNAKFKITLDNAKALGKIDEFDFQVAQIIKGMNADGTHTLVMRLSQTASILDGANLMARGVFEFLDPATKQKIIQLLGNQDTEREFVELFSAGVLNPVPLLDNFSKEAKGFFGNLHDAVRKAFAYIGEMLQIPSFKNEALKTKLFDYIRGADLKVTSKEIKGDELIQVKTLIDKTTGEIIDPIKMREVLNRTLEELRKVGFVSKDGGIEVGLDGVAWSALVLNNKKAFQELRTRSMALGVDIANKGQIGEQELINWQRMFVDNPDLIKLVIKEALVPEGLMQKFLEAKDFTGLASPNSEIYATIIKISSAFDVIPYESFNNDFGLLFRTQMNVLKSLEAVPIIEFMKKYMAFDTVEQLIEKENDQISHTFKRWSLSQNSFGEADQTTMIDNEVYRATLTELGAYLNNPQRGAYSDNLREIREIMRLKSLTADKFNELKTKIIELGDNGNAEEIALRQNLNSFIGDFMERQGTEVANAEIYIDRIITDSKVAGEMKQIMKDRLDTLQNPDELGGVLGGNVKAIIERGDDRAGLLNFQDELAKSQNATYANFASRKHTSIIDEGDVSKMRGFSHFRANKNDKGEIISNPLTRGFDGQLVPTSLHKVLNTVSGEPVEHLTEFAQKMRDFFIGVGEQEAKDVVKRRVSIINNYLPDFAKIGERKEKMFANLYEHLNYDYLLNLFKAHSLLSPAFHARNVLSGYYVNSVHGVSSSDGVKGLEASRYVRSGRFSPNNYSVDAKGIVTFKTQGLTQYDREMHTLIAEAQHSGVIGGGAISEIVKEDMSNRGWLNPLSLDFAPLTANRKIAEFAEDSMRLASFKHAREVLGYTPKESGDFVKMLHFDYNLLTDFERNKLKRVIPFYTYMRKAVARDSRLFVERTGQFYRTAQLTVDAENNVPPEKSTHVNSFIRDRLGVNFKVGEDGRHYYLLLGGVIPAGDLSLQLIDTKNIAQMKPSEAIKSIMLSIAKRTTPYLTKPAEAVFNYDFYFNKPIKEVQAEYADLFGVTVDTRTAYYLQQVRWLRDTSKAWHLIFDLKNSVRPDFPLPSESELGRLPGLMALGLGIDIRTNDKPLDNNYYNNILPRKKRYDALMQEVKRQAKIGNTPNYESAVQNVRQFLGETKDQFIKENSANKQILAEIENRPTR